VPPTDLVEEWSRFGLHSGDAVGGQHRRAMQDERP
jgi:hypothetical protein